MVELQKSAKKNRIILRQIATIVILKKSVESVFFNLTSLYSFSATYFTMPFWKPKVAIVSVEATKFLKFPTKANPLGPTKMAITFEVIRPIEILSPMLNPFKEAILNKSFLDMDFKKRN